jgi:hypothetical protein
MTEIVPGPGVQEQLNLLTLGLQRGDEAQLHLLADVCERISLSSGFAITTWATLPANLMFVVTEIDEASAAVERGEFGFEVADIAIRLLVHLHGIWRTDWNYRRSSTAVRFGLSKNAQLETVLNRVCAAAKFWRKGMTTQTSLDVRVCLEQSLGETIAIGDSFGFSVFRLACQKSEANRQRPRLHGHAEVIG